MAENKNALAELAEEIHRVDVHEPEMWVGHRKAVRKAQLIVAELAKVKGLDEHGQTYLFYRDETQMAYEKCRAIAEE